MAIEVRLLREGELAAADRVFRLAFGTFLDLPDPSSFAGDADYVYSRWRADPSAAFAALADREVIGTNFATRWGSFAFFGPLTVHPEYWERGVGQRLLVPTMERFAAWGVSHAGLYTFATSPKHAGLYQKFGFMPRFLTMITGKPVGAATRPRAMASFSAASGTRRAAALAGCREITEALLPGLDLGREVRAVDEQALGDTLLLYDDDGTLCAFAVCHSGARSEAGSGVCYVKFGAVRPGARAGADFERLLDLCEGYAAARGAAQLVAGVNSAREAAYRAMLARGYRIMVQGLAMQRPSEPAFNRPEVFVIDDWR